MDNLTINWREELIKLFPETTCRAKGEHDEWCPVCHGIGLVSKGNCVVGCANCNGKGVKKACSCGQKIDYPHYDACSSCRAKRWQKQQMERERKLFEKATKIPFKDYTGVFLWKERVIDKDGIEEEIDLMLFDGEEPPDYIWGTEKYKLFSSIDLEEVVLSKCEDGYEDMGDYFNFKDDDFLAAQSSLDLWLDKHASVTDIYYESSKTAVLLDSLIEAIKQQME